MTARNLCHRAPCVVVLDEDVRARTTYRWTVSVYCVRCASLFWWQCGMVASPSLYCSQVKLRVFFCVCERILLWSLRQYSQRTESSKIIVCALCVVSSHSINWQCFVNFYSFVTFYARLSTQNARCENIDFFLSVRSKLSKIIGLARANANINSSRHQFNSRHRIFYFFFGFPLILSLQIKTHLDSIDEKTIHMVSVSRIKSCELPLKCNQSQAAMRKRNISGIWIIKWREKTSAFVSSASTYRSFVSHATYERTCCCMHAIDKKNKICCKLEFCLEHVDHFNLKI